MNDIEQRLRMDSKNLHGNQSARMDDKVLDEAVMQGLVQGEKADRCRKRRNQGWGFAALALTSVIMILTITIITSPTITAKLMDIPGIRAFVKLIEGERALEKLKLEDFAQPIGISVERDGVKLSVDGMIIDTQRIVLLVSAERASTEPASTGGELEIIRSTISSKQENFQTSMSSYGYGNLSYFDPYREANVYRDMLNFILYAETQMPDEITLHSTLRHSITGVETELSVDIPIDHAKFADLSEEIFVNQTLDFQGQKMTIVKLVMSPLQMTLEVKYDPDNTHQILGHTGIYLQDENEEKYSYIGSTGLSGDHRFLYFQGKALQSSKQLILIGEFVEVMDKKQSRLVVDTERGIIIEAPDERIQLESVTPTEEYVEVEMSLNGLDEVESRTFYSVMLKNRFSDGDGSIWETMTPTYPLTPVKVQASHPDRQLLYYYLPREKYTQPLSFEIQQYPGYIQQPFRLQLLPRMNTP